MHDRGGEHLFLGKNRPGWVLVTEAIGAQPNNLVFSRKRTCEKQRSGKPVQQMFDLLYSLAVSLGKEVVAVKEDRG